MKITFHVLPSDSDEQRLIQTAKLCETALASNQRVFILTDVQTQAHRLDEFLWQYKDTSFLAHALITEHEQAPIVIGHHEQITSADRLINLSESTPEKANLFAFIDEIVIQEPKVLTTTRRHYKYYQSLGLTIETEKLS